MGRRGIRAKAKGNKACTGFQQQALKPRSIIIAMDSVLTEVSAILFRKT